MVHGRTGLSGVSLMVIFFLLVLDRLTKMSGDSFTGVFLGVGGDLRNDSSTNIISADPNFI